MSRMDGWPAMAGTLGRRPVEKIAEDVLERCPKRSPIAVVIDKQNRVWVDAPSDKWDGELVGVYRRTSDPDALADDLECVARERGIA